MEQSGQGIPEEEEEEHDDTYQYSATSTVLDLGNMAYFPDHSREASMIEQEQPGPSTSTLPEASFNDLPEAAAISKRTLQNRRAQREFRQRRASYIKDLERRVRQYESGGGGDTVHELRSSVARLSEENDYLSSTVSRLEGELADARRQWHSIRRASAISATTASPLQQGVSILGFASPMQQRPQSAQSGLVGPSHLYHASSSPHLRITTPSIYDPAYDNQTDWHRRMQQVSSPSYMAFRRTSHSTPVSPIDANPGLPPRSIMASRSSISSLPESGTGYLQAPPNLHCPPAHGQLPAAPNVHGLAPEPRIQSTRLVGLQVAPDGQYPQEYPSVLEQEGSLHQQYNHQPPQIQYPQPQYDPDCSQQGPPYVQSAYTSAGPSDFPNPGEPYAPPPALPGQTTHLDPNAAMRQESPASQVVSPTTFTMQMSLPPDMHEPDRGGY